jgi:hypothetical protein
MPSNIDSPIYEHCLVKEENGEYVYAGAPITYTPSLVADTIFFASRHACREIFVGTSGWLVTLAQFLMPGVLDFALSFPIINKLLQRTSKRRKKDQVNLMKPTNDEGGNRAKGSWGALSTSFSIYNTVYKLVVWVCCLFSPPFSPFFLSLLLSSPLPTLFTHLFLLRSFC